MYLCRGYGLTEVADYWDQVIKLNDYQKSRFANLMVSRMFNTVTGKRIAMLGFAFKKDTGDVRESAAAYVAKSLLAEKADLHVFDPKVKRASMVRAEIRGVWSIVAVLFHPTYISMRSVSLKSLTTPAA